MLSMHIIPGQLGYHSQKRHFESSTITSAFGCNFIERSEILPLLLNNAWRLWSIRARAVIRACPKRHIFKKNKVSIYLLQYQTCGVANLQSPRQGYVPWTDDIWPQHTWTARKAFYYVISLIKVKLKFMILEWWSKDIAHSMLLVYYIFCIAVHL